MAGKRTAENWERRYREGDLPWDSGCPCDELAARFDELALAARIRGDGHGQRSADSSVRVTALDIGCGTGTNAMWMAQRGFEIVGVDIAATAIERAREKAGRAGVANVRFVCGDILETLPVAMCSVDFVFDRGCFHTLEPEDRDPFVRRVAEVLRPDGHWLMLSGNADEQRGDRPGPPQLTAGQIVSAVETRFEIHRLRRFHFRDREGPSHLAWSSLARLRH